jgi:hypothetical protein
MSFFILNRGKKSSKFGQVIVNYGRFVGFKKQLGFFEFCYELALANHAENKCASIFYENVRFLGKTQNFQARRGRFSHDPRIFFCFIKPLVSISWFFRSVKFYLGINLHFKVVPIFQLQY